MLPQKVNECLKLVGMFAIIKSIRQTFIRRIADFDLISAESEM